MSLRVPLLVFLSLSSWALGWSADVQKQSGSDERLILLRDITANMFDTEGLGKDSCLHIRMKIITEPREGERMEQEAELYTGGTNTRFKSPVLEEYMDSKVHVRIWPGDRSIMITNSAPDKLDQTRQLMHSVNAAITENARVVSARNYTSEQGAPMMFLAIEVPVPALGGTVTQQVEIDLRHRVMRSIVLQMPSSHPVRKCTVFYTHTGTTRMPGPDHFIKGLLAQRRPLTTYKEHSVKDLRSTR